MVSTWNIVPDYDEWGYDNYWNCDDWTTWHKQLKAHFGEERARIIWNYAYAQGSQFSKHWDCRTFNSTFRAYAKANNLDTYASVTLPIIPQILDLSGSAFDIVGGVTDVVSEVASVFGNTKLVRVAIYTLLAGGVIYLGYRGYTFVKGKGNVK
jgi:hypothetical protein